MVEVTGHPPTDETNAAPAALEFEELYAELWHMAARLMKRESRAHTLQPTALVHEAYYRICRRRPDLLTRPEEFTNHAARAMRWILVDHARRRSLREDAFVDQVSAESALGRVFAEIGERSCDVVALDEALRELEQFDPGMARAVEMRFFAGLEFDVIARVLRVKKRTLERNWAITRRWFKRRLS